MEAIIKYLLFLLQIIVVLYLCLLSFHEEYVVKSYFFFSQKGVLRQHEKMHSLTICYFAVIYSVHERMNYFFVCFPCET